MPGATPISDDWLVITLAGARPADGLCAEFDLAAKIDAFTTLRAHDPLTLIAGKLFRRQLHMDGLRLKKLIVRHLSIGQHLLLVFVFNFWVHAFGKGFRRFAGSHPHRFSRFYINKCSGDLAPVAKLESTLAQAAASYDHYGVRGAAVDFNKSNRSEER